MPFKLRWRYCSIVGQFPWFTDTDRYIAKCVIFYVYGMKIDMKITEIMVFSRNRNTESVVYINRSPIEKVDSANN